MISWMWDTTGSHVVGCGPAWPPVAVQWNFGRTPLPHLGFDNEIVLGPYDKLSCQDRRSISGSASPNVDIPRLMTYNDENCQDIFRTSLYECSICFTGHRVCQIAMQAFLLSTPLPHLGFDNEIVLGPYDKLSCQDRRSISGSASPNVDIPRLMTYNDENCQDIFRTSLYECSICFTGYAGTEFVKLPCKHFFCRKCMQTYSTMHVKEGTVNMLLCPYAKCGGAVSPDLLKLLLADEEFERGETCMTPELKLQTLQVMCGNCGTYFCYLCGAAIDGYKHFRGFCELFPNEDLEEWEWRMNNDEL
ncbi:hypothetical protein Sjap_004178 [Stephania japonica]|uniref:Uncharacterized protein n=1 Tax=Stephania japonica TaxID=461633 RepID=A0AAP0K2U6_9MAGN